MRIPASEFHHFTNDPTDRSTYLLVETSDVTLTLRSGQTEIHLTKEQAEQLAEDIARWLKDDASGRWSDFWTLALK